MKKIEYVCDRCGAVLGAKMPSMQRISIQRKRKSFKLLLFKHWMSPEARFQYNCDEMELCEDCRKSFDDWLNGVEVK